MNYLQSFKNICFGSKNSNGCNRDLQITIDTMERHIRVYSIFDEYA